MALRDMKIGKRLGLGFALVLSLASATGLVAVVRIPRLSELLHTAYDHPFTVSIALRDIRVAVLQLDDLTHQAARASDPVERVRLSQEMTVLDNRVHVLFDLVQERYLGDPKDVREAHDVFRDWRPTRQALVTTAHLEDGAVALRLVERQNAETLVQLNAELEDVVDFAGRKAATLNAEASALHDQTMSQLLALLGVTLLAGVLVSAGITWSIARPLRQVVGQVLRVAEGGLEVDPSPPAADEVGEVAQAVQEMVAALRQAVEQAGRVARGDFAAVLTARSARDELGAALGAMTVALRDAAEESRREEWLKAGRAQLDDVLRGDRPLADLADGAVAFLARYLGAPVGALYAATPEGPLELVGRYALPAGGAHPARFAPGEGLVGQAALDRRPTLAAVPPEWLQASSGLGAAPVRAVAVIPLTRGEHLLGVLELGALEPFGQDARRLLEEATGPLAVALQSAHARVQLQQALAISQDQAQALQVQQEELRAANEELTEHAVQLRDSRSRLQDQQEELRASNEELAQKSAELEAQARSLEAQNRQLGEAQRELTAQAEALTGASRYKSQFLANMSHELRTPLNSLLLLARSFIDNRTGNLTEDQVESARVIQRSGQDLLSLINEVLDLSKIEAGRMEAAQEPVALRDATAALAREFARGAEEKGVTLAVEVAAAAPQALVTDPQRLAQILRNLLANALKFTAQGRIDLRVEPVAGAGGAPSLAFRVADTGIGIADEHQRRVFEAFHQGDGGTSRRFGGTGLGLTISRELAQLLGGTLTLESAPGRGSTFTLTLPLEPPRAQAPQSAPTSAPTPAGRADAGLPAPGSEAPAPPPGPPLPDDRQTLAPGDRVVLVVEDDLGFAGLLRRHCHEQGFKCLLAADGRAGLALATAHRPAAILLDIGLPGMDGWAVLDALKRTPDLRHIPVHMMSGQAATIDALRRGAVAFVEKPVSPEDLDAAFRRIRRLADRELRRLLVVEDDAVLRAQVVALVGGGDVACAEAATGEEALAALRGGAFDCVVLDLGLSDMSGFDLLDRLHAEGVPVPPVIVYTGRELTRAEAERLQHYAESVIVKGVKSAERLLDETSLFLHRVVSELPESQRRMIASLHDQDALFAGKRVLLVDDDMRNTFALAKLLRERDLEVHIASDGLQALAWLDQHPDVDVVLMDVMMPELDGYEATRRIRAQERFRRLPVIALTAKAMKDDRERCMQAGSSDYLPKPVDLERLLSMLRVWLYR